MKLILAIMTLVATPAFGYSARQDDVLQVSQAVSLAVGAKLICGTVDINQEYFTVVANLWQMDKDDLQLVKKLAESEREKHLMNADRIGKEEWCKIVIRSLNKVEVLGIKPIKPVGE